MTSSRKAYPKVPMISLVPAIRNIWNGPLMYYFIPYNGQECVDRSRSVRRATWTLEIVC
jgi:hypothetical protein